MTVAWHIIIPLIPTLIVVMLFICNALWQAWKTCTPTVSPSSIVASPPTSPSPTLPSSVTQLSGSPPAAPSPTLPSSVTQISVSRPKWEWLGDDIMWHAYDRKQRKNFEIAWKIDNTNDVPFQVHNINYVLHLRSMEQENTETHKRREVKRTFKEKVKLSDRSGYDLANPPKYWKNSKEMLLASSFFKIQLDATSDEFKRVQINFNATLPGIVIQSVERIENIELYDKYIREKIRKGRIAQTVEVKELALFHGTKDSNVDGICAQGFDWRLNGANATVFGKGSYFARDASYSKTYSTNYMFLADVFVGEYTQGNSGLVRPPTHADDKDKLYDSVVDNVGDPKIYVVFETCQAYPTWLIHY